MNLLTAKNLSHTFDYELFKEVDLELNQNESIAIIGMSGSGKSTLLHILSSLLKPHVGEVKIEDKNIYEMGQKHLAQLKFIYVGQLYVGTVTIPMIGISPTSF